MRWLVTKAFAQVVPKDKMPDPFKETKKVCIYFSYLSIDIFSFSNAFLITSQFVYFLSHNMSH